ncbi:MAG: ATP-binding protein [Planctomycetes bacterium]|nr:ATP-binding protein [Planctomycetota bacterium]
MPRLTGGNLRERSAMPNSLATGRDGNRFRFTLTLTTPADAPADAARLSEAIAPFLAEGNLPTAAAYAIHTGLEELITNLGKFGRSPAAADPAALVVDGLVVVDATGVELQLRDNGRPFDPTRQPPPVLAEDPESLAPGGLGLHMLRTMFTACEYSRHGEHNLSCWRLEAPAGR